MLLLLSMLMLMLLCISIFNALNANNAASPWQALVHSASCFYFGSNNANKYWRDVLSYYLWVPAMLPHCGKYWCTQAAAIKSKHKLLTAAFLFSLDDNGQCRISIRWLLIKTSWKYILLKEFGGYKLASFRSYAIYATIIIDIPVCLSTNVIMVL